MDAENSLQAAAARHGDQGLCAQHPDTPAVLTCSRCGDFACRACAASMFAERPLCKRCGGSDHEQLRKELGPHERQVRSIALYFWFIGLSLGIGGFLATFGAALGNSHESDSAPPEAIAFGVLAGGTAVSALYCVAAWHLQRFTKTGQVLGAIAAFPGLFGVPLGTLLSGFILWALFGQKGQAVFSEEYRGAIAATPQLKYGISIVTKVVLGLLGCFGLIAIAMMLAAAVQR